VDQFTGSKAYKNHTANVAIIAVAVAQFVAVGLLPLCADTFFIVGQPLPSSLLAGNPRTAVRLCPPPVLQETLEQDWLRNCDWKPTRI
jgi:hypothetical protein